MAYEPLLASYDAALVDDRHSLAYARAAIAGRPHGAVTARRC